MGNLLLFNTKPIIIYRLLHIFYFSLIYMHLFLILYCCTCIFIILNSSMTSRPTGAAAFLIIFEAANYAIIGIDCWRLHCQQMRQDFHDCRRAAKYYWPIWLVVLGEEHTLAFSAFLRFTRP